jgi:hypothetical protein
VVQEDVRENEEGDLQQQNNNNNVRTIVEHKSQVTPPPSFPSSCSSSQDNRINESQSISLDDAISLLSPLPASKSETSDLWNRIAPFSSIKVVVDTSQIKHIDDGSYDNIFWQVFDELQSRSPDIKTVNGYKLKARLVSTNKFFVGDAVLVIERMERTTKIKSEVSTNAKRDYKNDFNCDLLLSI